MVRELLSLSMAFICPNSCKHSWLRACVSSVCNSAAGRYYSTLYNKYVTQYACYKRIVDSVVAALLFPASAPVKCLSVFARQHVMTVRPSRWHDTKIGVSSDQWRSRNFFPRDGRNCGCDKRIYVENETLMIGWKCVVVQLSDHGYWN